MGVRFAERLGNPTKRPIREMVGVEAIRTWAMLSPLMNRAFCMWEVLLYSGDVWAFHGGSPPRPSRAILL